LQALVGKKRPPGHLRPRNSVPPVPDAGAPEDQVWGTGDGGRL
jgi:hypothetical protein